MLPYIHQKQEPPKKYKLQITSKRDMQLIVKVANRNELILVSAILSG